MNILHLKNMQILSELMLSLVDTYDTLKSGVPNAIRVFKEMRESGIELKNYGIRLDSGDLAYRSGERREGNFRTTQDLRTHIFLHLTIWTNI